MSYAIIRPPFALDFGEMSAERLGQYREWFLKLIPERIEQLSAVVHQSPAHAAWTADESPTSLDLLSDWFAAHVETRARTKEEIDRLTNNGKLTIEGVDKELTNETFSRATDVGMYLGRVILKNVPGAGWHQESKRTVNYGQVVIQGLGPIAFNPVRLVIVIAHAIAAGEVRTLRDLYDTRVKARS